MGFKIVSALLMSLVAGVFADSPYDEFRSGFEGRQSNLDEPKYRLKDYIQPYEVFVDLDVYLAESRFDGEVQINFAVIENNITQIVLHQNVVSISAVTVYTEAGVLVPLTFPDPFTTDSYYEILLINLASAINVGRYVLFISYKGRINENPLDRGFYKGYYFLNGQRRQYATTQFQPFHARKAFPCFDEPQFKSRFTISITRDSNLSPSYSNMAIATTENLNGSRIRETFLPTPLVSSYLIAFHVSDFVETSSTSTAAKPFKIISRQGVTSQHAYAAEVGVLITAWLDRFNNYEYYSMGQGVPMKNDHIALPDFPSGAMENWGMVNYREAYLLYDPQNTNLINKVFIATIIAHEMGHKWFGNLVTCFWWSNLWLNESFASYFEYFAANGADPSLELADQFIVDYVHSALQSDASASATPMNWTGVVTNPSISAHFSTTSYAKGASVLRMMEHFVGPATFQKALSYYLRDNAYSLGTPDLMYAAFRTAVAEDNSLSTYAGVDVADVFNSWVQNPGAPVIDVNVNTATGAITVTQNRFQLSGTVPTTLWQIPLTYTRENSADFTNTKPTTVMTTRTVTLNKPAGEEWVVFNVKQSGLYRVNYDVESWRRLASALLTDHESIHYLNRAQIVNDVLFFIRAGKIDIELAFEVLAFLQYESNYYVWSGALTQLDWLRRRVEHMPVLHERFTKYLLETMEWAVETLGFNERSTDTTSTIINRNILLNYACSLGHEECIEDAKAKWAAFRQNPNNLVPVNIRRHVYCVGLREGNYSDYEFLFNRYNTSQNTADMVVMLRALPCSKDQSAIAHYLRDTMFSSTVRIHDKTNAFSYALAGNPENLPTVLNFVYNNYAQMRNFYGGSARLTTAISSLAGYLTNFDDIIQFQTWLYQNQLNLPDEFATGTAVVSTAVNNLVWGNNNALDVNSYLLSTSGASSIVASMTLLSAVIFMVLAQ